MSYNYNKENLSWFRSIHNLITDFPLYFSLELEIKIINQANNEFRDKLVFKKKKERISLSEEKNKNIFII